MKGFVGITDNDWYAFLSQEPGIDEVNFWQQNSRRIRERQVLLHMPWQEAPCSPEQALSAQPKVPHLAQ